jgi:NAD(P)-dependent dehydrogenase (short-subunit alcohol dehydrogenase family)
MDLGAALVVGGTGGLGEHVVPALQGAGFITYFTGRRQDALDNLGRSVPGSIPRLLHGEDEGAMGRLIDEIDSRHGLAAYVHLAGGFAMGPTIDRLGDREWDAMFGKNWLTLRNGATSALAVFRRRGEGAIVTIGSLAAIFGGAGMAPYAVAKAAVVAFTRCLAEEGREYGVRANCVVPGILDTPGNRAAMPDADRSGWIPCGEVASAIVFLCSPSSRGVNGATILMKGGL